MWAEDPRDWLMAKSVLICGWCKCHCTASWPTAPKRMSCHLWKSNYQLLYFLWGTFSQPWVFLILLLSHSVGYSARACCPPLRFTRFGERGLTLSSPNQAVLRLVLLTFPSLLPVPSGDTPESLSCSAVPAKARVAGCAPSLALGTGSMFRHLESCFPFLSLNIALQTLFLTGSGQSLTPETISLHWQDGTCGFGSCA